MKTTSFWFWFWVVVVTVSLVPELGNGTQYEVGGSQGWDESTDYSTWAKAQTFKVGDTLLFKYASGIHDVVELGSESEYTKCDVTNPTNSLTGGSNIIKLNKVGTKYFACGTSGHCTAGMKLKVNVVAASDSPSPSPSPSPSTSPSPSSSSSSPSLSPSSSPLSSPSSSSSSSPPAPPSTSKSTSTSTSTSTSSAFSSHVCNVVYSSLIMGVVSLLLCNF